MKVEKSLFYQRDLIKAQWNKIKFIFEKQKKKGRATLNPLNVFKAILWILRAGVIYQIISVIGTVCAVGLNKVFLKKFYKLSIKVAKIDSTFCKVHQSACSKLKNQAIGISRGGKTTKIHALVNENFQLLNITLIAGNINDSECAIELLQAVQIEGKKVHADRAYSSSKLCDYIEKNGAKVCIPDKINFKIPHKFDSELYKQRNIIERFFQRIKNYRHIAFRFDKLSVCFLNFVLLAASVIHF